MVLNPVFRNLFGHTENDLASMLHGAFMESCLGYLLALAEVQKFVFVISSAPVFIRP
jgi:hypothetical protein